jgi:hypothetical protein
MSSTILHKRNPTQGVVPSVSALSAGEIAINTADGKFFTKTVANEVKTFLNSDQLPFSLDQSLSSVNYQYGENGVNGVLSVVLGGVSNSVSGAGSTVINGSDNTIDGDYAFIGNGSNNTINIEGDFGAIVGGQNNTLSHPETFILGSNISSHLSGFTYVNNLSSAGKIYGDGSQLTGIVAGDTVATTLVRTASSNWDFGYNFGTAYSLASSTFLTSETDSQTLSFNESTKALSISNGNVVSLSALVDSGGGSSSSNIRQFDMVYSPSTVSYSGTAASGSLTSQGVWTIVRIVYTTTGTVSAQGTASNAIWDNRLSLSGR